MTSPRAPPDRPGFSTGSRPPLPLDRNQRRRARLSTTFKTSTSAVAAVAGGAPIILIANPAQAIALRLFLPFSAGFEVLASTALGAGVIVAIAFELFSVRRRSCPRFELARDPTLTFDDATVADLVVVSAAFRPRR